MRQNTNRTETAFCKPHYGDRTTVIRMKRHRSAGNPYRIIATLFRTSFSRIRLSILLSVVSRQQTIPNDAFGLKIRSDEQKQSRSRVLSEKSGRPKRSGFPPTKPTAFRRPPPRTVNERSTNGICAALFFSQQHLHTLSILRSDGPSHEKPLVGRRPEPTSIRRFPPLSLHRQSSSSRRVAGTHARSRVRDRRTASKIISRSETPDDRAAKAHAFSGRSYRAESTRHADRSIPDPEGGGDTRPHYGGTMQYNDGEGPCGIFEWQAANRRVPDDREPVQSAARVRNLPARQATRTNAPDSNGNFGTSSCPRRPKRHTPRPTPHGNRHRRGGRGEKPPRRPDGRSVRFREFRHVP